MTNTPRTDAVAGDGWSGDAECVPADFARELERENARLAHQLEWVDAPLGPNDTAQTTQSLYRRFLLDTTDDHEQIEKLVAPFLTEHELHGDSYGVPSVVDLVETIVGKLTDAYVKAAAIDRIVKRLGCDVDQLCCDLNPNKEQS